MIQLSSITNAISNTAHSTAVHAKNLCVNSKVDTVFRTTVSAARAHPYITLLGVGIAVYCGRAQIGSLINKVKQAAHFLYTKATGSMTSLINFLRRNPEPMSEIPANTSDSSNLETSLTNPSKVASIASSSSGDILPPSKTELVNQ